MIFDFDNFNLSFAFSDNILSNIFGQQRYLIESQIIRGGLYLTFIVQEIKEKEKENQRK